MPVNSSVKKPILTFPFLSFVTRIYEYIGNGQTAIVFNPNQNLLHLPSSEATDQVRLDNSTKSTEAKSGSQCMQGMCIKRFVLVNILLFYHNAFL